MERSTGGGIATLILLGALATPASAQEPRQGQILNRPSCEGWEAGDGAWVDASDYYSDEDELPEDDHFMVLSLVGSEWRNDRGVFTCTVVERYFDRGGVGGVLTTTMTSPRRGAVRVEDASVDHAWTCDAGLLDPAVCAGLFGID